MKAHNGVFLSGLLALALCAPVFAHEPAHGGSYPHSQVTGNVSIWGNSAGYSAWSGNLVLGNAHVYPVGYLSWVGPPAIGKHHGAYCRHDVRRAHERGHAKRFKHGHGYWERHGHEHHGRR